MPAFAIVLLNSGQQRSAAHEGVGGSAGVVAGLVAAIPRVTRNRALMMVQSG